jgi:pimeloyl-CoA synthetase
MPIFIKVLNVLFPEKKGNQIQDETNKFWSSVKDKENAEHLVKQKIIDLTAIRRRAQGGLMSFWAKVRGAFLIEIVNSVYHDLAKLETDK